MRRNFLSMLELKLIYVSKRLPGRIGPHSFVGYLEQTLMFFLTIVFCRKNGTENLWWHHSMKKVSALLALCRGKSTGHLWIPLKKSQWCEVLILSLFVAWTNCRTNSPVDSDLRRHGVHVTAMRNKIQLIISYSPAFPSEWRHMAVNETNSTGQSDYSYTQKENVKVFSHYPPEWWNGLTGSPDTGTVIRITVTSYERTGV